LKTKTVKIALQGFGSYLGMEKGCFVVKDRNGETERYPLFENQISEVQIKSGKVALCVSISFLRACLRCISGHSCVHCVLYYRKNFTRKRY
jgi:hypothetical protein